MEYSGQQIRTVKSQIQVHNRFMLKETHKLSESIDFLAKMTGVIKRSLANKDLHVIPTRYLSRSSYLPLKRHLASQIPGRTWHTSYEAFQSLNDKSASTTVKEKFSHMLSCVKGMSVEKVSAVLDEFDTPKAMWEAVKLRMIEEERQKRGDSESLGAGDSESQCQSLGGGKGRKKKPRGPELFFADRIQGEGRRKIGDSLSRDVSIFGTLSSGR